MRHVFQLDAYNVADGFLEVAESQDGTVSIAVVRPGGDLMRLWLDKEGFKELSDLYYRIVWRSKEEVPF